MAKSSNTYMKGITIEIGGDTAPLNKALASVKEKGADIQRELKAVEALLKFDPSNTEALAKKQQLLTDALENSKEKLEVLKKAQAEVEAQFKAGTLGEDQYKDFQNRILYATADVKKAEKAIDDFGKECQESSKDAKAGGEDSEKAGKQAKQSGEDAKAGGNGWEKFGNLAKNAGKVAVAGIATIATGAGAAAAGIYKLGKDAGVAADDLITLSNQTGVSTDTLQGWQYAARFVDVEVEMLSKGLTRVTRAVGSATAANKDYIEIANGVTVSTKNANGELMSSEEIFYSAIDALGQMQNETEREIAAQKLFGKSYQDIMPLIKEGAGALAGYTEEARTMGLVLDENMVSKLGEFDDTMQKTEAQFEGIGKQIAVNFLPAIQKVGTGISAVMTDVSGALADGFQPEDIKTIGSSISAKLIEGMRKISEYLPAFLSTVISMFEEVLNLIISLLPDLIPVAVSALITITDALIGALPLLIDAALQLVIALALGIGNALPELIPSTIEAVLVIVENLLNNIDLLLDAALKLVVGLAMGIVNALPRLIEKIPILITAIVQAIVDNLPIILQAGATLIIELAKGLIKALPQLLSNVDDIWGGIWGAVSQYPSKMWEAGKNIVIGLWNGIKDMKAWLWDQVKGFAGSVLQSVKSALGIQSPSKVFRDIIGKNLVKGIGVGVDVETPNLQENLEKNLNNVTAGLQTTLDVQSSKLNVSAANIPGPVNLGGLNFNIEKFINNTKEDMQTLVKEAMIVAEEYISRKGGVFA